MKDDLLIKRLSALRVEYDKGAARLRDLRREEVEVRETLLRIEGALTILGELLEPAKSDGYISGSLSLGPPDDNDSEAFPPQPLL